MKEPKGKSVVLDAIRLFERFSHEASARAFIKEVIWGETPTVRDARAGATEGQYPSKKAKSLQRN